MSKFTIYSPNGTALYTGTPSFTGQYMKPGMLEFREIAFPSTLELTAGCYVDYTRTGFRYRIYIVPQVKKQARSLSYGGAFVYQGVQLYDASKMLEYCPFRDLVKGDNRIHFSTQPSISTFEGVDGLARRFEACLRDQYDVNGVQSWAVRIATDSENPDLHELMLDPREFTVSGLNILECLDKVYEIWPEVGWIYKVENGIDTIVIGGGGSNANEGTYAYGKGRGLTSLTRTVANADEMANRIYAYGDSRNMLPRWYNNQEIKDAESVDIQNLMIPVADWGTTDVEGDELPDAAKAYVEDAESVAKIGLRPITVYFDGKGEYPDIYPSIRNVTIGMVRDAMESTDRYYPSTAIYLNPDARVDKIQNAQLHFDSGLAAVDGKSAVAMDYDDFSESGSGTAPGALEYLQKLNLSPFLTQDIELDESGDLSVVVNVMPVGSVTTTLGYVGIIISAYSVVENVETLIQKSETKMVAPSAGSVWELTGAYMKIQGHSFPTNANLRIKANIVLAKSNQTSDGTYSYSFEGSSSVKASRFRAKTFTIKIRQIGFDIGAQAAIGEGKTIAMRSGKCQGRSFAINDVQYDDGADRWVLECWRSEDESLSQWFPNTDYPIETGDEFVLLDIAMPELYVGMAENRLLQAAEDLLSDTATERWQYVPEIDAKYMVENSRTIRAGEYLALIDSDLIEGTGSGDIQYFRTSSGDYFLTSNGDRILLSGSGGVARALVDTIVINEGEAAIPTYKVTLRDRKRKTWTESESPSESTSKSVGNASDDGSYIDLSNYVTNEDFLELTERVSVLESESFFTLDSDGNVTLKPQYTNLWVPGWLSAGGVGSGGGGGVTSLYALTEVDPTTNPSSNDVFYFNGTKWTNTPLKTINNTSIIGSGNISISGGGSSVSIDNLLTTGTRVATITIDGTNYNILAPTSGGSGSGEVDPVFTASAAYNITTQDITNWNNKGTITGITMNGVSKGTSGVVDLGTVITSHQSLADYALKVGASTYNFEVATLILPNGTLGQYTGSGYLDERIKFTYTDNSSYPPTVGTRILAYTNDIPTALKNPKALTFGSKTYDGSVAKEILASDLGAVTLTGTQTITGAKTFSAATTFSGNIAVGGTVSVAGKDMIDLTQSGMTMFGFGSRAERSFNAYGTTVNLRACDANGDQVNILSVQNGAVVVGSKLIPNYTTGLDLGGNASNQRWNKIYGVGADLTGDVTLASTSHIDLGPIRIEYDSVNKAIHVKKADSSDTNTYGLYCDGFISAGGVQASS